MKTNYDKLKNSLENIKSQYEAYINKQKNGFEDEVQQKIYETALVKCFENSFEMAWKHLKKYLGEQGLNGIPNTSKSIFRKAYESGLVEYIDLWLEYCEKRNFTTHDYDSEKAFDVLKNIADFIEDLQSLCDELIKNG